MNTEQYSLIYKVGRHLKCAKVYKAYGAQYGREYCAVTFIAVWFYVLGVYYNKKSLYWHSTYAHCMLHIIANIANFILYSGQITYHENKKSF